MSTYPVAVLDLACLVCVKNTSTSSRALLCCPIKISVLFLTFCVCGSYFRTLLVNFTSDFIVKKLRTINCIRIKYNNCKTRKISLLTGNQCRRRRRCREEIVRDEHCVRKRSCPWSSCRKLLTAFSFRAR